MHPLEAPEACHIPHTAAEADNRHTGPVLERKGGTLQVLQGAEARQSRLGRLGAAGGIAPMISRL